MNNIKYFGPEQHGFPTNDDVAAMRLVNTLVGTPVAKGPLWDFLPGYHRAEAVAGDVVDPAGVGAGIDWGVAGRPAAPETVRDAITLWESAVYDIENQFRAPSQWLMAVNARAALNAAPVNTTYPYWIDGGMKKSDSIEATQARQRTLGRLAKYGGIYGVNVVSMARALATVLTDRLNRRDGTPAYQSLRHTHVTAHPDLTAARLDTLATRGFEIYSTMFGVPVYTDPTSFADASTMPPQAFSGRSGGGRRKSKRMSRRKSKRFY